MTPRRRQEWLLALLALAAMGLWVWELSTARPARGAVPVTHTLAMTMVFKEMGGGGTMDATLGFTSQALCKSVRRAIWSQLSGADGDLGDCLPVTPAQP